MFVSVPLRRLTAATLLLLITLSGRALSQSAAEHIAVGDREHAALSVAGALHHYQEALKVEPRSYEALWKASREAMDVGEYASKAERDSLFSVAELYARRAMEANPDGAEGHFAMSRALGKQALSVGRRDRVRYAVDVRHHALEALKWDARHAGALHVMGMWHYNVMSLGSMVRFLARSLKGGKVLDSASWAEAQRYMEESVASEPERLVHRLDLGRVYAARGARDRAREQLELVVRGARTSLNDRRYQSEAAEELKKLR